MPTYYENLPDKIKKQVLLFLNSDDFVSAKVVYDAWFKEYKTDQIDEQPKVGSSDS